MTRLPTNETLPIWLQDRLPPNEKTFSEIVQTYIASPDRARFLLTLAHVEKGAEVYNKLAETLLLYHDNLIQQAEQACTIRRAYQHYIVNTDGPIPLRKGEDAFDVFAWACEYADTFNITLTETTAADGTRETLMTIDDQENPVRCEAWGPIEGQSSALSLRQVGHLINYRRYGRTDVIPSLLFPFDPHSRSYSKFNAMWLADLTQLVYLNKSYVQTQLKHWGFESVHWIDTRDIDIFRIDTKDTDTKDTDTKDTDTKDTDTKDTDTQVFVAAQKDYLVVSFRGTKGVRDFLTDVLFRKVPFHSGGHEAQSVGRVHRGFLEAFESVWNKVLAAVNKLGPDRPIFVTGHSLGAALAQLAAMRLVGQGKTVAAVYVYGSPCLGDEAFRDAYNSVLKAQTFLHINDIDIVTTVPMRWMGFHHVAQPARRFNQAHQITDYDTESELQAVVAPDEDVKVANRKLLEQAAAVIRASNRYLEISDLTTMAANGLTYGAEFKEGKIDDHGIAQYLFKFACSIVDDKMAAMQ